MSSPKLKRVAAALKASGINAMILLPGANLYYTLGINQMLRKRPIIYAVFPDARLAASLPLLEVPDFRARWPEAEVVSWTDPEGPEAAAKKLGAIIRARAGTSTPRVAAENFAMRIFERSLLLPGLPGVEFEIAEKILDPLRMIKDPEDVEAMRQACRIAEESLARVIKRFRRGMTEREIGNELKIEMLRLGTEADLPKDPVVSSGPRTAFPHTKSSDRPVTVGDALMIDTGARYHGYCSDITRTFFVGPPPARFVEIYEQELACDRQVIAAIKPGVTLTELDELAHRIMDEAGYGQYFPHRVGHGLGIEGHEVPSVVTGNRMVAAPGLTFTVEPGIFILDFGGVRVEENVAVTADGVDVLTAYPRELQVL
ncbi:MAG TPA: Xaa-Pro peptidase family protein [Candidatus Sulfotelmatobacter sp.]|nr:Xaa-Pro peptidase family protein [Candidatus Sulfotelmatobacter sp.]